MDLPGGGTSLKMILRLAEVLESTGLSRATLYNRISEGEFPRQVSLGGRAVGWLKSEVDSWISERIRLRPGSPTETSGWATERGHGAGRDDRSGRRRTQQSAERVNCTLSMNGGAPNQADLHLVSTKVYFDKSSGCFWLKLVDEGSTGRGGRPHTRHDGR